MESSIVRLGSFQVVNKNSSQILASDFHCFIADINNQQLVLKIIIVSLKLYDVKKSTLLFVYGLVVRVDGQIFFSSSFRYVAYILYTYIIISTTKPNINIFFIEREN